MSARAVLPNLDHFTFTDGQEVYEPSDDTFLLCDALENDREIFKAMAPGVTILEVGSGSGCVITFLTRLFASENIVGVSFAADINPKAIEMTRRTSSLNKADVDLVFSDLASNFISQCIDVLIFNPPYVPTPADEVGGTGIEAAWAGGRNGRVVIDRFLPLVKQLLSSHGVCYMVLVEENKPADISRILSSLGFSTTIVLRRRAVNEGLMIMKITHLL